MAKCWTCGTHTEYPSFTCPACRTIEQLKYLRKENITNLNALAEIQRHGFDNLSNKLSEIASVIEWGFEEISWQLQQQTDILQSINHTLKTPSQTQANEWRQMAEELRGRGVLDKAEDFFVKSIDTNPLDYRTYVGLAETYLQINEFDKAKRYLEDSIPHAPDSRYKSYSYRLIGHIYACIEDFPNAISALQSAMVLSPDYHEAIYDFAQYNAQAKNKVSCLMALKNIIIQDSFYFYLTQKERNFEPLLPEVGNLLDEIRTNAYNKAEENISKAKEMLKAAEESVAKTQEFLVRFVDGKSVLCPIIELVDDAKSKLNLIEKNITSGDYKTFLEINPISEKVYNLAGRIKTEADQICKYSYYDRIKEAISAASVAIVVSLWFIPGIFVFTLIATSASHIVIKCIGIGLGIPIIVFIISFFVYLSKCLRYYDYKKAIW